MRKRRYPREADRLLPLMLRRTGPIGGTAVGSAASDVTPAHGDLRGLTADDHLQYVHTALPRTITATHNFTGLTGFTSPDQDSVAYVGRAALGSVGYGDLAGFAHRAMASPGNYALMQDRTGGVALNSPTKIYHRISNLDVLTMDNSSVKVAGANRATVQTENYASQVAGWGGTYDGAWDVRYLFTDQLHAKLFVADLKRALAGIEIIAKSVTLLGANFTLPYAGSSTTITVKDLPSAAGMQVFELNDFINAPTFSRAGGAFTIGDCWGTVSSPADNGDGTQNWTFTRSGTTTYNTIGRRASLSPTASVGASIVINRPTGTANGDFLLAHFFTVSTVSSVPAGWLPLGSATIAGGTLYVYYKFASGEPASWTWGTASSGAWAADCHGWTNVSSVQAIDKSVFGTNGNNTSLASYGVDPSSAAGMLILFGGVPANIRATPPAGMTEGTDFGTSSGASAYMAFQLLASDAATGIKSATLASASPSATCLLVLAPTYSAMSSDAGAALPMTTLLAEQGQNAAVLDYGVSNNGWIENNAIDGLYAVNAPYTQIVTWATHPSNKTVRARLGNLKGLFGVAGEYGLYVGDGITATNRYVRISSYTQESHNVPNRMYSGSTLVAEMDNVSGIGLLEDVYGTWAQQRAIEWWPDLTNKAGNPSLQIRTGKIPSGPTAGQNWSQINAYPTGGQLARIDVIASGASGYVSALMELIGGMSGSPNSLATVQASQLTANVDVLKIAPFVGSASVLSWQSTPLTGTWSTAGWLRPIELLNGGAIVWPHTGSGSSRMIGSTSNGAFYIGRSTANDNSAAATYDLSIDTSGNTVIGNTIKTALGVSWDMGGYTAGAPSATGYVSVKVNGVTYKFLAST